MKSKFKAAKTPKPFKEPKDPKLPGATATNKR